MSASYAVDRVGQCIAELEAAGVDAIGIGAELFAAALAKLLDIDMREARPMALVELDSVLARRTDILAMTCLTRPASEENREKRERYLAVVNWAERAVKRGRARKYSDGDMALELMAQSLAVLYGCGHQIARLVAVGWYERKNDEINALILSLQAQKDAGPVN